MEQLIATFKSMTITMLSVIMAYFAPISNMVFVIFFIFLVNCLAGIVSGIAVNDERFDLKKFFHCIFETFVFYMIVACVYVIGEHMGNQTGAVQCITGIVYAIVYFYSVNTLRNVVQLFPDSRPLQFLYYVVSFEVIKKLPYLEQFEKRQKEVSYENRK